MWVKRTSWWVSKANERAVILSDTWLAGAKAEVSRVSAMYYIIIALVMKGSGKLERVGKRMRWLVIGKISDLVCGVIVQPTEPPWTYDKRYIWERKTSKKAEKIKFCTVTVVWTVNAMEQQHARQNSPVKTTPYQKLLFIKPKHHS